MELYEVREMMAKELRGILHDEFNAYLEKYDGAAGDNRRDVYDIILFYHHDPRVMLYIDIAKATSIMHFFKTTKNSGEYIKCCYLQQGEALEDTLLRYDFSADFLDWLIGRYTAQDMPAEVLIIEKVIERRRLHTKNNRERLSL